MSEKCDEQIFQNGSPIALFSGKAQEIGAIVQEATRQTGALLDWHYSGGVAQVLALINSPKQWESVVAFFRASDAAKPVRDISSNPLILMNTFEYGGGAGLYREGVTPVPEGAIAAAYDGDVGSSFLLDRS